MAQKRSDFMGEEHIGRLLFKLSSPAMIGMLVQAGYNLVDTFFVGRGVGVLAIGGLSIAFPLQMIIMATSQMIGIGGSSIISRSLGKGDVAHADRTFGTMLTAIFILSVLIAFVGLRWLEPILGLLGATPAILPYACEYMRIIFLGTVVFSFSITCNNVVRSEGNAHFAMMTMLISAGVNTALDPIFIFGLDMGVSGAAWATVISQGSTALWLGWYFYRGKSDVTLKRSAIGLDGPILKETIAIGLSAFSRQSSASLTAVILNHSLGIYGGDLAIAAFGIIRRLMMFAVMPVFGVVQGLLPIIGFNYGGKQYCRVKIAVYLAIGFSTLLCTVSAVFLMIFPKFILSLFTTNSDVIALGTTASRIIAIGLPLVGFQTMASGMYQAIGKALPAFILSILRTILLLIPMVLVMPLFWGLMGIWIAYPAADIGAFIVILFMFRVEMNYLKHTCDDEG